MKRARHGYVRLVRSPGAPSEIAGGMAVGLFISMLPVIQTPVAVGVAETLRRVFRVPVSRVAAVAGVFLTNPLTGPVFYGAAFLVGRPFAQLLFPHAPPLGSAGAHLSLHGITGAGPFAAEVLTALAVGGALLGIPIAVAGYFITRALVRRYQARIAKRVRARPPQRPVMAAAA